MLDWLREAALDWYVLLNTPSTWLAGPLGQAARQSDLPVLAAMLFGLVGSLAPCQVTANVSAMAYLGRQAGERRRVWPGALGFVLGKVLVYSILGGVAILLGFKLPTPVMVWIRQLLGPMLIVFGLYYLHVLRLRFTLGEGLVQRLDARLRGGATGGGGAFMLGGIYSLAFCPTMALLFFGILVPLGLRSPTGLALPAFFGVGTAVPLLLFAAVLALGLDDAAALNRRARRWDRWLRVGVGVVFLLAGLNDTFVYWFL